MAEDGVVQIPSSPSGDAEQQNPMDVESRPVGPSKIVDETMRDVMPDASITLPGNTSKPNSNGAVAPLPPVTSVKALYGSQPSAQGPKAGAAAQTPSSFGPPTSSSFAYPAAQLNQQSASSQPDAGRTSPAVVASSSVLPSEGTFASVPATGALDAGLRNQRIAQIDAEAAAVSAKWVHPPGASQVDSGVLHRVRAILNLYPQVSQSGIARITGISQGILSHYMHGRYRGNQDNMERRLGMFVSAFLNGEHDGMLRGKSTPSRGRGSRGRGRGRARGRSRSVSLGDDRERLMMDKIQQKQMQTRYEVHQRLAGGDQSLREAEFQRAQRIQMQLQHQQRMQHQMQRQGQLRGQNRGHVHQQQYLQQQKHQMQQHQLQYQQQQYQQQQQYLMQQRRASQPAQPTVQPLSPSVAVERAYHAYHSAKWAGSTHGTEPLLVPVEINVSVSPGESGAFPTNAKSTDTNADDMAPMTDIASTTAAELHLTENSLEGDKTIRAANALSPDDGANMTDDIPADEATAAQSSKHMGGTEVVDGNLVSAGGKKLAHSLHYFTQWDVNERHLSPEEVSKNIVESSGCVPGLIPKVSAQIRRSLFEAGVSCPVPPEERSKENRRLIKIRVTLGDRPEEVLEDSFEWDLCAGDYNSPEIFSQHLCADTGFSQFHVPKVAQEIRRQVAIAQAISYGDDETRALALARLPADHPLRESLPVLESAIRTMSPEEIRAKEREENEELISEICMEPLLHDVLLESKKRVADRVREAAEKLLREEEEKNQKELRAETERKRIEKKSALLQLDANVHRVKNDHDIDLKPYLQLQLGRGARPSVWLEGLLIRKKRGLPVMPATEQQAEPTGATTAATSEVAATPTPRPRGRPRKNSQSGKSVETRKSTTPRQGTKRRASAGSSSRAQPAAEPPKPKRGPPRRRDANASPVDRRRRSSTRGSQTQPSKRSRK